MGEPDLPMPPLELRQLIGPTDPELYRCPGATDTFETVLPETSYESVFDFGCGCGRIARALMQKRPPPRRYVGIDIDLRLIDWCRKNLQPHDANFEFLHHDVHHASLNQGDAKPSVLEFPVEDGVFDLLIAHSVFTHLYQAQAEHYLNEIRRTLAPRGYAFTTWFLFEKSNFPMMQQFQNSLFINEIDPTNAVIFDRSWLEQSLREADLKVVAAHPPELRGYHWRLVIARADHPTPQAEIPSEDQAPVVADRDRKNLSPPRPETIPDS